MQDATTAQQLELLAVVHQRLADAQMPHWLAGGWGIDFLLGRITRPHGDIDFAIWMHDWPSVAALLLDLGFTLRHNDFPNETDRLLKEECKFEFYLLQKNQEDCIVVGGRWSDWPFLEGAFGPQQPS